MGRKRRKARRAKRRQRRKERRRKVFGGIKKAGVTAGKGIAKAVEVSKKISPTAIVSSAIPIIPEAFTSIKDIISGGNGENNPINDSGISKEELARRRSEARQILLSTKVEAVFSEPSRLQNLFVELAEQLAEPHRFDIFAPNSVNFGILVNYRQEWKPEDYQVGEMVGSIPLAPKETRKYSKKRKVVTKRNRKEIESNLYNSKKETQETRRADAEIVRKAAQKTNFSISSEGTFNFKLGSIRTNTGFEKDDSKESSKTKKTFRESVLKAAQEYKQERKVEISTDELFESEFTESGEISNPNDEIPVTFLFFELQRRYRINEKIHSLTPVILVANEVPKPEEIDEDWLIKHDWILRRAMLDDSFIPALDFLSQSLIGEEFSLDLLQDHAETQASIVEDLRQQITSRQDSLDTLTKRIEELVEEKARIRAQNSNEGLLEKLDEKFFGGGEGGDLEIIKVRESYLQSSSERLEDELMGIQRQLVQANSLLDKATQDLVIATKDHLNKQTEINRLRIHVKDNILHYMQAIWEYEPTDQRYFRLYNIEVPNLEKRYTKQQPINKFRKLDIKNPLAFSADFEGVNRNVNRYAFELSAPKISLARAGEKLPTKKLVEICDLDNLIGFKGNYMMFPMKEDNVITKFMKASYEDYSGEQVKLRDADPFGNFTFEEFKDYLKKVHEINPELLSQEEIKEAVCHVMTQKLLQPDDDENIVIVPTDSLYIESLPGTNPLLEDFKLVHRAIDVKKVQAEVRHMELENIRLAARLNEEDFEDSNIEKRIEILNKDNHSTNIQE